MENPSCEKHAQKAWPTFTVSREVKEIRLAVFFNIYFSFFRK